MKSQALKAMPYKARQALTKFGQDIRIARKKRRISTTSMAERCFITRTTLLKVERGDPSVSIGIYATVLAILDLAERLGDVAERSQDLLGLDLEEERLPKNIIAKRRKKLMAETIEVHIELSGITRRVGTLRYFSKHGSQSSGFEYHPEWLTYEGAFAIDPVNLPLVNTPSYHRSDKSALPGALRDTAPDRWGQMLIKRALRKAGEEKTLLETDYLLAMNDLTRIGALRYRREGETNFDYDVSRYRIPPLIQLPALLNATDAVQANTETANDLRLLLNEGSPLGGARPKSAVQEKDGTLAIAKFPKKDEERNIPKGELLAMTLARRAGILTAPARLVKVSGRAVALIGRFDRTKGERIPFVSAMSLFGLDDGDHGTYIGLTDLIRQHCDRPTENLHELWRRLIFNILASNLDDHLRNHGFLYVKKGQWALSPAYDLNPVPISEKARELTTWISEKAPDASLKLAMEYHNHFALRKSEAKKIIDKITKVTDAWRGVAKEIGMNAQDVAAYATAFEHPMLLTN